MAPEPLFRCLNRTFRFRLLLAAALVAGVAPSAFSQQTSVPVPTPAVKPIAFEVASIHPHEGPLRTVMGFSSSGPRVRLEGYNFRGLVMEAYNLRNFQVSMPGIDEQQDTNYDIVATAPEGATPTRDEFRRMLQTLLADRYQLKAHFEMKQMPVYALVVAKGGPKLAPGTDEQHEVHGVDGRNFFLETDSIMMSDLASEIWNRFISDRPVVDRTGLGGTYKLRMEATPEFRIASDPQPGDLSIFTAVQEQLGLKLEPSKAPIETIVVDHVDRPSAN